MKNLELSQEEISVIIMGLDKIEYDSKRILRNKNMGDNWVNYYENVLKTIYKLKTKL